MSENPYESCTHAGEAAKRRNRFAGWGTPLTIAGIGCLLVLFFTPVARMIPRQPARRTQCTNNLREIAMVLYQYQVTHGEFPPAYTVDANGKPLHSWRTLILPLLGRRDLYESIDLTKPWNDPANSAAYNTTVPIFLCPSATCPRNHTTYLANAAKDGFFSAAEPRKLADITDVQGKTLLVIEVDSHQSVHWMSPLDADEARILSIGESASPHSGGMNAAMCDGSVLFLRGNMPAADRRAMISIANGDKFEFYDN